MSEDPSFSPGQHSSNGAPPDRAQPNGAPLGGVLTVTAPPTQAGRSVAVGPRGTTVGRDATCDLALASEHIGRHQAVVRVHGTLYVVEDLGSKIPTLLNGAPVVGTRPLHDGDRLTFADVDVQFRLMALQAGPPRGSSPSAAEHWRQDAATDLLASAPDGTRWPLRQELRESHGFSATALLLAVLGTVVATALTGAAGAGQWGTLVGAAVGPVVTTTFTTKKAGEKGRVRTATIIVLSVAALVITWVGIGLADQVAGESVIPGTRDRSSTFPMPAGGGEKSPDGGGGASTEPAPGPQFLAPQAIDCGTIGVGASVPCPAVEIRSVGTEVLRITRVEVTGNDRGDFMPGEQCAGTEISPGDSCTLTVDFNPSSQGTDELLPDDRTATLVIHENLPSPDTGIRVELTGVVGS
jgi:pSer/pThr/pTyr-binding forkhead associated (FHA) protein